MTIKQSGYVRAAVDSDIPIIEAWLKLHTGVETLAMNWNVTLQVYRESGMLVYEDASSREAVAYFWGSLNSTDSILEVRSDQRGFGIGTVFVEYLLDKARSDGEGLLRIDCAASSENFWKKMGFEIKETERQVIGKRIIEIPRSLPAPAEPAEVIVRFYPESASYQAHGVTPLAEFRPKAVKDEQGLIWFDEKISCFDPDQGDLVVELIIGGLRVCRGKAKHEQPRTIGFFRCRNGYAIEKISLPS